MRILLVTGSTRSASTNSALLRTAASDPPDGVEAEYCDALGALPHFVPDLDRDPLPPAVASLRDAVAAADAVLFCTPEYAGTLPGSFKNLLDWLVGGTEITGKPVAWVNAAADGNRGGGARATLETVLGYVQARAVAEACRHVPVSRDVVGPDGLIADPAVRAGIGAVLQVLATAAGSPATPPPVVE